MVIYRSHAGTLEEAMKTKVEFSDFEEMKSYIVNYWRDSCFGKPPFEIKDIVIKDEPFHDPRIGWRDTRHVCIKRFGNQEYIFPQCIGWCATDYDK